MNFTSASKKLDWADDYIARLNADIRTFFDGEDYRFVATLNENTAIENPTPMQILSNQTENAIWDFTLRIRQEAPTDRWSLMLGDIINNLRSCLDHCVYALAVIGSGEEIPPKYWGLKFPICKNQSDFDKEAPNSLLNVQKPAFDTILAAQPFDNLDAPLWLLKEFSNADKHRIIHLTVAFLREFSFYDTKTIGRESVKVTYGYTYESGGKLIIPLYDGFQIGSTQFGTVEVSRAADVQSDAVFEVIFDESALTPHRGVCDLLGEIAREVRKVFDSLQTTIQDK